MVPGLDEGYRAGSIERSSQDDPERGIDRERERNEREQQREEIEREKERIKINTCMKRDIDIYCRRVIYISDRLTSQ